MFVLRDDTTNFNMAWYFHLRRTYISKLFHFMNIPRHFYLYIFALIAIFSAPFDLHAQRSEGQRSYTAPMESTEWVILGNSDNIKYECDLNSLVRVDSTHIRIHIKETPVKFTHYETMRAKMWDHRSIQAYSDSLRKKPEFYFEGYERYGFTIKEEKIEYYKGEFNILYTADYDLGGILLSNTVSGTEDEQPVANKSPEHMVIEMLLQDKAKLSGRK